MTSPGRPAPTVEARDLDETALPGAVPESRLGADCQAWSLDWAGQPLSVGRAGVNDFVINDVTMPRVAGLLVSRQERWFWRAIGSDVEEPLGPERPLRLGDLELRIVPAEVMNEVLATGGCEGLAKRVGLLG
jgi:hypothetical protein